MEGSTLSRNDTRRAFLQKLLKGAAAGVVASQLGLERLLLANDACDRLPYDLAYDDPRLPFHHLTLEQLTSLWRDAATGIESWGLIDNRHELADEQRNKAADLENFCSQNMANPQLVILPNGTVNTDGTVNIYGYGYPAKPIVNEATRERDWRQGDSVMLIQRLPDGSYRRHRESILAFPPAPEGQLWNTIGGFGTGMSVLHLPRPLRSGFQFLGLVNHMNYRDQREMWVLTGSPDGIDWYFEGKDGNPTKDAFAARPFMASYDFAPLRNLHGVLVYDERREKVYALLGHAASYSLCTYLARFDLNRDKTFGHDEGAFVDVWENKTPFDEPRQLPMSNAANVAALKSEYALSCPNKRPYLTEGRWRPSTGIWTKEQTENVGAHAYLSDLVDPMAATPFGDGRFIFTYDGLEGFGSPKVDFRIGVFSGDDSSPIHWGPRGGVNLNKLWINEYLACTAGGVGAALLPRADGKVELFVTTARKSCFMGREDQVGVPECTYQPGGLKHGICRALKY